MGYPLRSFEGAVTSWGSTNFYSTLLAAIRPASCRVTISAPGVPVTGYTAASQQIIRNLGEVTVEISAFAFATPRMGTQGLVTFSPTTGTYITHADEWDWEISWPEHDITEFNGTAPTWRSFMPGGPAVNRGRFRARPTSDTALTNPFIIGTPASDPTLTLRYGDSATDETLAGTASVTQLAVSQAMGEPQYAEYQFEFDGDVTPAGTGSLFGTTALGACPWSAGGSAAGALVISTKDTSTVKTISLADSFVTRIAMSVKVGEPTRIDLSVRGTGAVTMA